MIDSGKVSWDECLFNWVIIVLCFLVLYSCDILFVWGLLEAIDHDAEATLIASGIIFLIAALILLIVVIIGSIHKKKRMAEEERRKEELRLKDLAEMEAHMKAKDEERRRNREAAAARRTKSRG